MQKAITLLCCVALLTACNSAKRTQKFLASGNYDQAIGLAVKKLQKDKTSSKSDELIVLLEDAFQKVVVEDQRRIDFLQAEKNPVNAREIYHLYRGLQYRQDVIRPLLPLYSDILRRNADFNFQNYRNNILTAKEGYALALYNDGKRFMSKGTIHGYREAYGSFAELSKIQRNYKDTEALMEDAHYRGTDFVHVTLRNRSGQIIPRRLERELLDFNTYNLDDFWTEYHNEKDSGTDYNFGIALNFRQIDISPERISEKEYIRRKRIKDGWEYELDGNGNVMKDSLGNDIKIDKYINVRATLYVSEQTKSVLVGGNVVYRDLMSQRDMDRFPLSTEFIFENIFAEYRGDERALTKEDKELVKNDFIPFPSHAQMVLDAGDDIKARLRDILKSNSIRR